MKAPQYTIESKLRDALNKGTLIVKYSDIRNVLKALHNKKNVFVARTKRLEPSVPRITLNTDQVFINVTNVDSFRTNKDDQPSFSIKGPWDVKYKETTLNHLKEILYVEDYEHLLSSWQKYKEEYLDYLKNKDTYKEIKTTVVDYINTVCSYLTHNNQRHNEYIMSDGNVLRNYMDIYVPKAIAKNAAFAQRILEVTGINTIQNLSWRHIHNISMYPNRHIKNVLRELNRCVPTAHRFKRSSWMSAHILDILFDLYNIKYKGEAFDNALLYINPRTKDVEWNRGDTFSIGLNIYPNRYIKQNLAHKCELCEEEKYFICDHGYIGTPRTPEVSEYLKYVKAKFNNIIPDMPIESTEDFLKNIKILVERKKNANKNTPRGAEYTPPEPYWGNVNNYWIDLSKRNESDLFKVCMNCWELKVRQRHRDEDRENKFILNYTANPLQYILPKASAIFPSNSIKLHNLAKGEKPKIMDVNLKGLKTPVKQDNTLYMGVELEVTPSDYILNVLKDSGISANHLKNEAKNFTSEIINEFLSRKQVGIMKADATVVGGFEIVSVPGTHLWHTTEAWNGFFKEDYKENSEEYLNSPSHFLSGWRNNGGKRKNHVDILGEDYPTCGIHIHVSRDALTPLGVSKLTCFINSEDTYTKDFVWRVAGRKPSKLFELRKKNLKVGAKALTDLRHSGQTFINGEAERHQALNLNTHKPTIEFRIFRSNVAKHGFMKNIDFVHALVTFCEVASMKELNVAKFCDFVESNKGTYKYLTKWLVHNKYIKQVHTLNPKYTKEYHFDDEAMLTKVA